MRAYKREEMERTIVEQKVTRSAKKRIRAREVADVMLLVALAVILLVFAVVVIGGINVREIPAAISVLWCGMVAYVITWAMNWGK